MKLTLWNKYALSKHKGRLINLLNYLSKASQTKSKKGKSDKKKKNCTKSKE